MIKIFRTDHQSKVINTSLLSVEIIIQHVFGSYASNKKTGKTKI